MNQSAEYYAYVRSMIMAEFPCPPLPVAGSKHADNSGAILNSHDMISVFMITAMQMNNEQFNAARRARQEALETTYRQQLAKASTFEDIYRAMSSFTQDYIHSYMLHSGDTHVAVLPPEHASVPVRRQILSFTNACAILAGENPPIADAAKPPDDISDERVRGLIQECAKRINSCV
jgi:hypothetical protein